MVAVVVSVRACVGLCRRRKGGRVWGETIVRSFVVRSFGAATHIVGFVSFGIGVLRTSC